MNSSSTVSVAPINPAAEYVVVDLRSGLVVFRTTYAKRNVARAYADRRDTAHGAHRFNATLAEFVK